MIRGVFFSLLSLMSFTFAHGQVVIGSNLTNERAAILDIKSQEANAANETSSQGGVLLPRIALVNPYTLEPFVSTSDVEWTDRVKKEALLKEHIGLEVYNVTNNTELKSGAYVWNGTLWERLFKKVEPLVPNRIVFPLPAFNLPLINKNNIDIKRFTVNLYQVYLNNRHANNFITNMPNKGEFVVNNSYKNDELDYVVTHYDKEIITIHSISNTGIMDYTVHNINPDSSHFLTIYLVVHQGKEKK